MGERDALASAMVNGSSLLADGFPRPDELPLKRDPFFCGRAHEMARLAEELLFYDDVQESHDTPKIVILVGEAGIGKISLALEFCYRYRLFWPAILWLYGDVHLSGGIDACDQMVNPALWEQRCNRRNQPPSLDRHEVLPPLLVIDHLQDVRQIEDWPARFKGWCVLLTARAEEWPAHLCAHLHVLERLSLAESMEILRKRAGWEGRPCDDSLNALAGLLEQHPLALRLAGSTLAGGREDDIPSYLADLETEGQLFSCTPRDNPVNSSPVWKMPVCWTAFSQYWSRIVDRDDWYFLRKVLAVCGTCAPFTPLPIPILSAALGCDRADCVQAVKALANLGFLEEGRDGPLILETMGEYARYLDLLEGWNMLEKSIVAWDEEMSDFLGGHRNPLDASLSAHLLYLAGMGERNQMRRSGSLWYTLAHHVQERGAYAQAEMYYLHALDNDIVAFGDGHIRVAIIYYHLGNVAQIQSDWDKARWNYERALTIFRGLLAETDPLILHTISKLERLREIS